MNPEYIHSRLEEKADEFEGKELKDQVEDVLDDEEINYNLKTLGGLKNPRHKEYVYELASDEDGSFELKLITYDGRPSRENGSVELDSTE